MAIDCKICRDLIKEGTCETCLSDLQANFNFQSIASPSKNLDFLIYFGDFHDISKQYIYECKYFNSANIYHTIAKYISLEIGSLPNNSLVSYVPTSWLRFCMRGFNPSRVLAKHLANFTKEKMQKIFKRIRPHRGLTQMGKNERIRFNQSSFDILNENALQDIENLYLIDDIFTTGSTLDTLAGLARQINPNLKITAICFVKTPLDRLKLLSAISDEIFLN